jgi:hypothetical protein
MIDLCEFRSPLRGLEKMRERKTQKAIFAAKTKPKAKPWKFSLFSFYIKPKHQNLTGKLKRIIHAAGLCRNYLILYQINFKLRG